MFSFKFIFAENYGKIYPKKCELLRKIFRLYITVWSKLKSLRKAEHLRQFGHQEMRTSKQERHQPPRSAARDTWNNQNMQNNYQISNDVGDWMENGVYFELKFCFFFKFCF